MQLILIASWQNRKFRMIRADQKIEALEEEQKANKHH
jgi:hypothetical protein